MKFIFTIILILNCLYNSSAQNGVITGKVVPEVKTEFDFIKNIVKVLICTDCEEFSTTLDENLSFEFQNIKPGNFEIWIEPHSKYTYDFKSGILKPNENLKIEIPVAFSCIYDQSENDKTCPNCQKQNRVIPVVFGLLSYSTRKYYHLGHLRTDCEPNWYCKRDKTLF